MPRPPVLFRSVLLLGGLLAGGFLGGCGPAGTDQDAPLHESSETAFPRHTGNQQAFAAAAGTRKAALALLDSLKRSALRDAFAPLERLGYTRRVRTERLAEGGQVEAFEQRVVRYAPGGDGGARVLRSDSAGALASSALGRFAGSDEADPGAPSANLAQQVLPSEFPFLSKRNRYAFQYRRLPDTTLASGPAHVVFVRARPDAEGENQSIRYARLTIDEDTRQLVGLRMHRVRRSTLFDEETRQLVRLRPLPGRSARPPDSTRWVPAETRFATRLHVLLRPPRRFRSTASYFQYRRPRDA